MPPWLLKNRRCWNCQRWGGERIPQNYHSIPVRVTLERTSDLHTDVVSLLLGWNRKLCSQSREVQPGDLLVQFLGQQVDIVFVALVLLPIFQQVELTKNLVGK